MVDFSPVGRVCSFCGAVGTRKTKFAGGLGAMMCQDCLEYYHDEFSRRSGSRRSRDRRGSP